LNKSGENQENGKGEMETRVLDKSDETQEIVKSDESDDDESFLSCRSNSECSYYSFESDNTSFLPDKNDWVSDDELQDLFDQPLNERFDELVSEPHGDISALDWCAESQNSWCEGLDTDSGYQASQDGDSAGSLDLIKISLGIGKAISSSSGSSSSLSVKEEEDFLLSGKARLRVKSLGGERSPWQTPAVRRRATVGDLEPARKTSPKPPWNYGAGGTMGRGVFQVPTTPSLPRRAHRQPNV